MVLPLGLPWRSSGSHSALPLQGARVQSLVGELRSHMLCGVAKKKKKWYYVLALL